MPDKNPLFSVIVPAYNEEKYIEGCLKNLLDQDIPKSLYEVIVVDNDSSDSTSDLAKKYPVKVVNEAKKGNVFARIKGVMESKAPIIAFTDADCRVPKDWLSRFKKHFDKDSKLDAVGGVFEFYDGSNFLKSMAKITKKGVYHVSGGNMAIRKKSLERLGGFDPKIVVGEDTVLHFKMKKEGKEIIDYSLVVQTSARRFKDNLPKTLFVYFTNDLWLRLFSKAFFRSFGDVR